MFLTETWLADNDTVVAGECTPPGYDFLNFLTEFETFIDELSILPCQLVFLEDFNLHIDTPDKWDAKQFLSILSSSGFC